MQLYIIATPIGNIKEITYRAVEVLQSVDIILAEDTRHSGILLNAYNIKKPMISYQKHSEKSKTETVLKLLGEGKNIALISDAGMPLISDPGSFLLSKVIEAKYAYTVISGPCACINALVLSGLDTSSFCMIGFLPEKNIDRDRQIDKFRALEATLIVYSPPHNVLDDLNYLFGKLGRRKVSVVREISKMFEEVIFGRLGEIPQFTLKGEFVIVIEGAPSPSEKLSKKSIIEHLQLYIDGGMDKKSAIKKVAEDRKIAKSIVYGEALGLK